MSKSIPAGVVKHSIVILGSGGVGKSSLTLRLVSDRFLEEYDATIEDSYRKTVDLDGQFVILDILDTAGQEDFSAMLDSWIREGDGFMLVYSVSSRSSFDDLDRLYNRILQSTDADPGTVPVVMVGNKCDVSTMDREVSYEEGTQLAKEWNAAFFEASAKENINATSCFLQAAREIDRHCGTAPVDKKHRLRCKIL